MAAKRAAGAAPVRPGETITVAVHGLGAAGEGVARYRDFAMFIPGAVPGDTVSARVDVVKASYARAHLVRVLAPAPSRVEPPCPVFAACGGCQLQAIAYPEQLALKTRQVSDALSRIGHLTGVTVHPCLGMEDPWHYRGKAQFPVGWRAGRVVAGFYAAGSHEIVDIDDCLIQHATANRILVAAKGLAARYRLPIYHEAGHTGVLRHVLARVSPTSGEAMCVLVTNGPHLPRGQELARELMTRVPGLVSVAQNINPRITNVVLGDETVILAGQESITDHVGDLAFLISPRSFFQVNPVQTETLYRTALDYAALTGGETAVDVYCGIGGISLFLARRAGRVVGIEAVPEAVADAKKNADLNGIANAEFRLGAAEEELPRLVQEGLQPQVVLVDPPRRGCDEAVLAAMAGLSPRRIVYVSCNPASLARDLARLAELGYRTLEVQPVDMFPHTAHVECVARLVRGG